MECPFNDLLIEAFGITGKNGRVGNLEVLAKETKIVLEVLKDEQSKIKTEQLKLNAKLMLFATTSAAAGSGAVMGLIKLLT